MTSLCTSMKPVTSSLRLRMESKKARHIYNLLGICDWSVGRGGRTIFRCDRVFCDLRLRPMVRHIGDEVSMYDDPLQASPEEPGSL